MVVIWLGVQYIDWSGGCIYIILQSENAIGKGDEIERTLET